MSKYVISESLVTPIFLHTGMISTRVSSADFILENPLLLCIAHGWMDACVVIKKISTCGGYTQPAKNPELVLISTWMPYHNMIDAYMDLDQPIP